MATTIEYQQIVNQGFLYINGMIVSNDATTPNTILDVASGLCRDSTNQIDINLGNFLGDNSEVTNANVVTKLNIAVNGVNGLDTGTVAASKIYAIYVIADPQKYNQPAVIASLALTNPLMPFGYGLWRLIGYAVTDASAHFLPAYISGPYNNRSFVFDAPQATALTAGAATTYTGVSLAKWVPAFNNIPVILLADLLPGGGAGDTLKLQPGNATGDAVTITGQVTTVHMTLNVSVLSQLVTAVPTVNYKVTSASDTAVLSVAGFNFYV